MDLARFPYLSGGCRIELDGKRLQLSAAGAFGEMPFARCDISLKIRVGGSGHAWIEGMGIAGKSPCLDAAPCRTEQHSMAPWPARVDRQGGHVRLSVDVCLDTCIGRFEGKWALDLFDHRRGWRARADRTMVGTSGWRIDGVFASPTRLAIAAHNTPR